MTELTDNEHPNPMTPEEINKVFYINMEDYQLRDDFFHGPEETALQKIKDEVASERGNYQTGYYKDFKHFIDDRKIDGIDRYSLMDEDLEMIDECMRRYAKYALEKAAENAKIIVSPCCGKCPDEETCTAFCSGSEMIVDKSSITDIEL